MKYTRNTPPTNALQTSVFKMKRLAAWLIFTLAFSSSNHAQSTYFPPNNSSTWDTLSPQSLNWCTENIDSLYSFLEAKNTKGFLLLKGGKIVLEQYFNGHSANANWYWASAGKTLTAFLVGMAQQENYLSIGDTTATYLGQNWTNCTPEQEEKITIWNQLTMTSGLDDAIPDQSCTLDTCLNYLAAPGTRWSYHNAPYTLLDKVIENAVGATLNQYITQKLKNPIGMTGSFLPVDYNTVYFSNCRSMARFGLLIQNKGKWNGNQIMTDSVYFQNMLNTSQNLNKSYGYLWWLNGKPSFMVPSSQVVFPFQLMPNAPNDALMALGKNGQFINISSSENLVWIRMGDATDNDPVSFLLNDEIWKHINQLSCTFLATDKLNNPLEDVRVFPNPVSSEIQLSSTVIGDNYSIINSLGQEIWQGKTLEGIDFSFLSPSMYYLQINSSGFISYGKFQKK